MNSELHLLEIESMGDVVSCEEGGNQVGDGAGLATVRTELKGVQSSLPVEGQIMIQCTTSSKTCRISQCSFLTLNVCLCKKCIFIGASTSRRAFV